MMQVFLHNDVERVSEAREISDLLVVAAVARDQEWHHYDFRCPTCDQLVDRILKSRGRRLRPHEEADLDRAARPNLGHTYPDVGVPDGVATVCNYKRTNSLRLRCARLQTTRNAPDQRDRFPGHQCSCQRSRTVKINPDEVNRN